MDYLQTSWISAVIAAILIGMSKGGLNMISVLAVPVMSLTIPPVTAAGILLPVFIIADLGGLIAFRRSFDRRVLVTLLPGAIAGVAIGGLTAHLVNDRVITLIIGSIGVWFALNTIIKPASAPARSSDWKRGSLWGALAGYTSFISHSGAPPYQVYVQPMQMQSAVYAGTTAIFFASVNVVKLIPYAVLGQLNSANLLVSAILLIPAGLGILLGLKLLKKISQSVFYKLITWALLIISLWLIWGGFSEI